MGQVTENILIKNYDDIVKFELGLINESEIRELNVEAIIDTSKSFLLLPPKAIKYLELKFLRSYYNKSEIPKVEIKSYQGAMIFVKDRYALIPVTENKDDDMPALLGVLALEAMDYIVNPLSGQVEGNPEIGRAHV